MDRDVIFEYAGKTIRGKATETSMSIDASGLISTMKCDVSFIVDTVFNDSVNHPTRILQSGNRTIVFWNDGTKTIVKRAEDEADNPYVAFTAALAIKTYVFSPSLKSM